MTDTKDTNPKEAFGDAKVPVGLVPDTALIEMAVGMLEGALKYGGHNYRVKGVKASTYNHAMDRHRKKWWNGQDRDPLTRVHELASVMCCCAILIDSEICGMLTDDRPPVAPIGPLLDDRMEIVAHLKELFKDHNPHQYTWEDSPGLQCQDEGCPHYGTPHGHTTATNEATVEPEGFPGGYSIEVTDPTPEGAAHRESPKVTVTYLDGGGPYYSGPYYGPPHDHNHVTAAPPGPLQLDCGCVKRCKGHPASSPGNYAQERAAGVTATSDAEFPHAPSAGWLIRASLTPPTDPPRQS